MAPFFVLLSVFFLLRLSGLAGWDYMNDSHAALQGAVAAMLLLTASAHWGKRRPDLIRMVPPALPKPELIVTITGVLELAGAVGILIRPLSFAASLCLALLLLAMFPANIRAAREKLTILGRPTPGLLVRSVLQVVFIAAVLLAG
ncbi:hypothetical protein ACFFNY_21670 [Paenibacillus hodogayensis]|uniref:DoxX family membrane protein n=1 Tax=Paenibacillus hodogayensis TaxID=279208 RepID=A0ABV5W0V2_9BACL